MTIPSNPTAYSPVEGALSLTETHGTFRWEPGEHGSANVLAVVTRMRSTDADMGGGASTQPKSSETY